MKIRFWSIGKSHDTYVKEGIESFTKKINHYYPADWSIIPSPKNAGMMSEMDLKKKEADTLLDLIHPADYLVLLDERGKLLSSDQMAVFLQQKANESIKQVIFLIGGAFGVHESIRKRADYVWSLSPLVFPHQLVRLMLSEQIYRACTIIRNEKYHHS